MMTHDRRTEMAGRRLHAGATHRCFVSAILVCCASAAVRPATVRADDGGKEVRVHVSTILATKEHDRIDPKLERIADQLKKTFKFTGFELKGDATQSGPFDKKIDFSLPSPYLLEITPLSKKKNAVTLHIEVFVKKGNKKTSKLSSTITVCPKKHQLIGGMQVEGGQLVLAISGA